MFILILGAPGSGKGTQGKILAERLGLPKITTGDLLRAAMKDGTPLGLDARIRCLGWVTLSGAATHAGLTLLVPYATPPGVFRELDALLAVAQEKKSAST